MDKHIDQIEMVRRRAVRYISNLRGREEVTSERKALGLVLLQDRIKDARVKLLIKILPSDTNSVADLGVCPICHGGTLKLYQKIFFSKICYLFQKN